MWNNHLNELWSIVDSITGITSVAGGFQATGGIGTLYRNSTFTADGTELPLNRKLDGSGIALRFLGDGHRLDSHGGTGTEPVGRGWLEPSGSTNDFLFTATKVPVPEPASFLLLTLGLGLLGAARRLLK